MPRWLLCQDAQGCERIVFLQGATSLSKRGDCRIVVHFSRWLPFPSDTLHYSSPASRDAAWSKLAGTKR